MRRKNTGYGLIIALVLMLSTSCASDESIRIGVIGTMSGVGSDLSVSGRRGVELAVDQINQSGGIDNKSVEVVLKDDLNSVEEALKANQEFVEDDVRLIIGHFTSGMVMGVLDYINSEDVLMLGPTVSADELTAIDDNFIRFIDSTRAQAEVLTDVIQASGGRRIMVVYDQSNRGFVNGLIDNFEILLKEKTKINATVLAYSPKNLENFMHTVQEVVRYKPDGLFIVSGAEESARLARNVKMELENVQLYGPLWANTSELLRKGGTAVEGMILVGGIDLEDESRDFLEFKRDFYDRYGEFPTFASMYAYEAMMALFEAIQNSKSTDPKQVKASILEISKFDGIQEDFKIDIYGDITRNYHAYKIESGKYRKVDLDE